MKTWIPVSILVFTLSGCVSTTEYNQLQKKNAQQALLIQQQQEKLDALKGNNTKGYALRAPKKNIKLKKVEDENYSSEYMYPQTKKPKPNKPVPLSNTSITNNPMNKTKCIAMIGADKFDKYTKMFGNEAASIKRCAMLKSMR